MTDTTYVAFIVLTGLLGIVAAAGTGWFISKLFRGKTIRDITATANEIVELYQSKVSILESHLAEANKKLDSVLAEFTSLKTRNGVLEELLLKARPGSVTIPK